MTLQTVSSGQQALAAAVQGIIDWINGNRPDQGPPFTSSAPSLPSTATHWDVLNLAMPGSPTITPIGGTGATSATYWIGVRDADGNWQIGAGTTIANSQAGPFTATVYNQVSFPAVVGAGQYTVFRQIGVGAIQGLSPFVSGVPQLLASPTPNTGTVTFNDDNTRTWATATGITVPTTAVQPGYLRLGVTNGSRPQIAHISAGARPGGTIALGTFLDLIFSTITDNLVPPTISERFRITAAAHLVTSGSVPTAGALQTGVASQSIANNDTRPVMQVTTSGTPPVANGQIMAVTYASAFSGNASGLAGGQANFTDYLFAQGAGTAALYTRETLLAGQSYTANGVVIA